MTIYKVHHTTTYAYRQPVGFGEHRMMLRPREGHDQRLIESDLRITPRPASLRDERDVFDNIIDIARFDRRAGELRVESVTRVEQQPSHPRGFRIADSALTWPFQFAAEHLPDIAGYVELAHGDDPGAVEAWARGFLRAGRPTPTLDMLAAMTKAIRAGFTYVRRTEKGIQSPAQTLRAGSGTCRDFTILMMEAVRSLGLPARFVSGYLYVPSRDRHGLHGGGSTHAWLQVFLPGAGWIDFDPTNAVIGNEGLIRVAVARDPAHAAPLSGSFIGFASDDLGMTVTVQVLAESGAASEQLRANSVA